MSSNSEARESAEITPVKISRLTRRGVLLGLSFTQLVTLGIGIASLVSTFYASGGTIIALTAPVSVLAAALT